MAKPKGSPKTGGRKKGTPNKVSTALQEALTEAPASRKLGQLRKHIPQPTIGMLRSRNQYPKLIAELKKCSEAEQVGRLRNLCRTDLFFLLRYGCGRTDVDKDWVFDRSREVQAEPHGHLDLWAREHFKSSLITFGLTIQEILASHGDNPLIDEEPSASSVTRDRSPKRSCARSRLSLRPTSG
jgi:hypothetical protein